MGISVNVSHGRDEADVRRRVEWDGTSEPSYVSYCGSGSRTTPKEASDRALLIQQAAQIGGILDGFKEFPKRSVDFVESVALEFDGNALNIAINTRAPSEEAFDILANLLLILSKAVNMTTKEILEKVDAESWPGLRAAIPADKLQELAQYASGPGLAELL